MMVQDWDMLGPSDSNKFASSRSRDYGRLSAVSSEDEVAFTKGELTWRSGEPRVTCEMRTDQRRD
jgi:hypothetical protein